MTDIRATDILVNGEAVADSEGLNLAELLIRLGEPADQVATALNGSFVARDRRDDVQLSGGDRITVFKAIVGG